MLILILISLLPLARSELYSCINELSQIMVHILSFENDKYSMMARYSGRNINDLGDYSACANFDEADYVLFKLSEDKQLFWTLCGSKLCTEEDYRTLINIFQDRFSNSTSLDLPNIRRIIWDSYNQNIPNLPKINELDGIEVSDIVYSQTYIHDHFSELTWGAILMITLSSIILLMVIIGSLLEYLQSSKDISTPIHPDSILPTFETSEHSISSYFLLRTHKRSQLITEIFRCFSIFSNLRTLFSRRSSERVSFGDKLDVLDSIRVMSMGWIILGHAFYIRVLLIPLSNPQDILIWLTHTKGFIFTGSQYAVDTFFWLSGFLAAYLYILQYTSRSHISLLYALPSRLYRILPLYMYILFMTWTILKYTGNGPVWYQADSINSGCENNWWTNLLFVNNFVEIDDQCFGLGWYLANDMQFFVVGMIVMYVYVRSNRLGWVLLLTLLFMHLLTNALIANYYDFGIAILDPNSNMLNKLYNRPYARVGAYVLGMIFGMCYYTYSYYRRHGVIYDKVCYGLYRLVSYRYLRYLLYLISLFLINYFIFLQHAAVKDAAESDGQDKLSQNERNAFYAWNRIGVMMGIGIIVYCLMIGYEAMVGKLLSLEVWSYLSRLTFSAYLMHFNVMYVIMLSQPKAYYISDMNLLNDFLSSWIVIYLCAALVYLFIESPCLNLVKVLRYYNSK